MKHIKLRADYNDGRNIKFYIISQSHRCKDFADGADEFKAKNGWRLVSAGGPALHPHNMTFYLRGCVESTDNNSLVASHDTYQKIIEAVDEYNEYYRAKGLPDNLFEV